MYTFKEYASFILQYFVCQLISMPMSVLRTATQLWMCGGSAKPMVMQVIDYIGVFLHQVLSLNIRKQ